MKHASAPQKPATPLPPGRPRSGLWMSGLVVAVLVGVAIAIRAPRSGVGSSASTAGAGSGRTGTREVVSVDPEASLTNTTREAGSRAGAATGGNPNKPLPNPLRPLIEKAVRDSLREEDPVQRLEVLEAVLTSIPVGDIGLALSVLTDPDFEKDGAELRQRLFERWGRQDPATAADWVRRMSPGDGRSEAYGDIARGFSGRDVAAARNWALGLSEPLDREAALIQVSYELARRRPVEALELAVKLRPTPRRDELLTHSASQWATQNPQEAVAWASAVGDEPLRQRLLKDIVTEWGEADPMAAATSAVKNLPEGRVQNDAVVGIVQRWAQTDPEVAGAWVAAFPEGDLRQTAGRELVTIWAELSVESAGNWLNRLSAGGFRDEAVSAYVDKILPSAPDVAAVWALEIADPAMRAEQMERVGTDWLEVDPAAAQSWIAQAGLAPDVKARLLTPRSPAPEP